MKHRIIFFILIIGTMVFTSTLLAVAQSAMPVSGTAQSVSSTGSPILSFTSEPTPTPSLTPTPYYPNYLPIVMKNRKACLTVPVLLAPPKGSELDNLIPLFEWDSGIDENASQYFMQVSLNPEFTSVVNQVYYGKGQGYGSFRLFSNLQPSTTYWWRGKVICDNQPSPYSEAWSFTTGHDGVLPPAPTLVSPSNESTITSTNVVLQWTAVSGAGEYEVFLQRGNGGNQVYRLNDTQKSVSVSPGYTYTWWVIARNDYAYGDSSEKWKFNTASINAPETTQLSSCTLPVVDTSGIFTCLGENPQAINSPDKSDFIYTKRLTSSGELRKFRQK